ncbi:hypothetical protein [Nocardioides solisilvae]|uniref:hypothetical protein n=1 Tax=Nocardioides solisilvae TaxID=1542435 RepID=UPI000D74BF6B|nr:hypothetical protein [Nocardioides solisilvae]
MITMVLISSVAMLVGIVGSVVIWRFDAMRAEEIAHTPAIIPLPLRQVSASAPAAAIGGSDELPPAA